jgi:ADP-heptose:LPS heptosyltransferase
MTCMADKDDPVEQGSMKRVLIINLGGIGDILFSTPALRALKKLYPDAKMSILLDSRTREAGVDLPYIDDAYALHMSSSRADWLSNMRDNLKTLLALRQKKFGIAINMRTIATAAGAFKMRMLLAAISPKAAAGRNTEGRGAFFNIAIPETDIGDKHEMEYDLDLVRKLGARPDDKKIDYEVTDEAIKKAREALKEENIADDEIIIGIHPGGKLSHRWPIENFAKAMRLIRGEINCSFVITGDSRESPLAESLVNISGIKGINTAGRFNIMEFGALIRQCDVFISNDTGAVHIAAFVKTPVVMIFGPGVLAKVDPRVISDEAVVLYKGSDCAPCNRKECRSKKCLAGISPREVADAALFLLGSKRM